MKQTKTSFVGYLLCGAVVAVLLVSGLLLSSRGGRIVSGPLTALLLVGTVLPLASAVWSTAFRGR